MNSQDLIRQAHTALNTGQKRQAYRLLQEAVRHDPQNDAAWLWLASVTPDPQSCLDYVKRAEMLNPGSPTVQKARTWAEQRLTMAQKNKNGETAVSQQPFSSSGLKIYALAIGGSIATIAVVLLLAAFLLGWTPFARQATTVAPAFTPVIASASHLNANRMPQATAVQAQATSPVPAATPSPTAPRIQAKKVAAVSDTLPSQNDPRPTWTLTPTPTNTPIPTPTPIPTFVSPLAQKPAVRPWGLGTNERWVDVDLTQQLLRAYEGDIPVLESYISSGTWQHPTVTGQFRIYIMYESQTMDGRRLGYDYYLEGVPYVMYFYEDYALHGTYWHNNFGTPMSHGCVNMKTADAQWLFSWAAIGTVVNIHY